MNTRNRTKMLYLRYLFFLIIMILFGWDGANIGWCASAPAIRIADRNGPKSIIVVNDMASSQTVSAAKLLSHYISLSVNVKLELIKESEIKAGNGKIKIWLGQTNYLKGLKTLNVDSLDEDGFVIFFPNKKNIVIAGPTDWGTEFGVYEFLERFVGVRWLLPGSDGEYVPEKDVIEFLPTNLRQEPAFISRELSGLKNSDQVTWARKNRMRGRITFHHNLKNLFPPEKYSLSHPEFYPIREGKRYIPPKGAVGWQPCFSERGVKEEAIRNINEYFDKNPYVSSYSLGINDKGGFCEDSSARNFLGYKDLSNIYYKWANEVAAGVLATHPNKWFGCLAYREIAQPPSKINLNPKIVPYLTFDRMKWIDEGVEREGKRITQLWSHKATFLGWYDYIYGSPYMVPRVYFRQMSKNYSYAFKTHVKAIYAEAYPNWGEGPKLYVALKLQWDPEANIDQLLNDWYVKAVGKDAAPYLAKYYELWEEFWSKRIKGSRWFKGSKSEYLLFKNPAYLDYVTYEDINKSRRLLEVVVKKAGTQKEKARAMMIYHAFEFYEACTISYLGLVRKVNLQGKEAGYYQEMNEKRYRLINEFEKDPVLVHPIRFDIFKELKW